MTGGSIKAEVYAKYLDPDPSNWTAALHDLMAAIAGGTAPTGTVIEAVPPVGGDGFPFAGLLDAAKAGDTGTRAYLNILLFDENLGFLDAAYVPVTTAAKENGTNVPHEKLSQEIVVQQPGYAYIYFSNDDEQPLEVFFDDFTVTHSHSAIVQADDYYPFGMTFNSYKRENSMMNRYLYNGKELQNELGLDWYDYGARMYDASIGRFFTQDRFAEKYLDFSPYQYAANNPIKYIDVNGDSLWIQIGSNEKNRALYVDGNLYNADGSAYSGKGVKKDGTLKGFLKSTVSALGELSSSSATGNGLVSDLQSSENNFTIRRGSNEFVPDSKRLAAANLGELSNELSGLPKTGSGGTIFFNPNSRLGGYDINGNRSRPAFLGLGHELFHASDSNLGILHLTSDFNNPLTGTNYLSTIDGLLKAEISAVNQENQLRNELGIPLRQHYGIDQGKPSGPRLVPFFLQQATYLYR